MIRILFVIHLWMLSCCVHAWSWEDLWRTKDQQGAQAMRQGNTEKAAKEFQSPVWRGVANYRSNNFEDAAADFANQNTDISHYNRGNALAKSQRFQEALNEYEQALKLNPNFSDAKTNRDIVKKLLEKQPKKNQSQDSKNKSSSSSNEQQGSSQSNDSQNNSSSNSNEQQASSESKDSQKKSSPHPNDQQNSSQKKDTQNNAQNDSNQQKNKGPYKNDRSSQKEQKGRSAQDDDNNKQQQALGEANQSQEHNQPNKVDEKDQQWLQKIPDDPGGLLRRKFIRDYEREQQGESS
jgi:Ca-activated chloride channel family protein